jgi:CubicO group peptidase (beta-lactamase class C family)
MLSTLALAAALTAPQTARLDAVMRYVMHDRSIRAMTVGIVRDGAVTIRAYGTAHPNTHFAIGSLSKAFVAATALRLADADELSLDERVATIDSDFTAARDVTLAQLLNQTSGIPDYAELPSFDRFDRTARSPRSLIAPAASLPLRFAAGSDFDYSNTNYVLAGMAIEGAARLPLFEAERRAIFDPLRMTATHRWEPRAPESDRASGSVPSGSPSLAYAAADIESNARDMTRWVRELLAPVALSRTDVARMTTKATLSDGTLSAYGMGFFVTTIYGIPAATASGYVNGFSSFAAIVPRKHTGVVLLSNADRVDLGPAAKSAIAAALDIPE